jgi:TRAP-type uncharacterized transport system substrate-binding protein
MRVALRRMFRISNPPTGPMNPGERKEGWQRRARIMLRHTALILVALVLLSGGVGAIAYYFLSQPESLRIAVGPPNSEDVRVVQAIASQLSRDRANIRLHVNVVEGGPAAAAAAIDKDQADLAVVRRDVAMPRDGQAVAILRKNVVVFVVPSAPPSAPPAAAKAKKGKTAAKAKEAVDKIEGLVGRRLGVVGRTPVNIELLKVILRQYNIASDRIVMLKAEDLAKPNEPDKINVFQIEISNITSAIRDSNLDAVMTVGPVSSPITADVITAATRGKEPPTFLAIGAAEAIAERSPIYESSEIKAGAFGGSPPRPEENIDTIEVSHFIVANKKLHESTVADFTKQLFSIRQGLFSEMASAAKIEKPDTDKDAPVPVHPGASAYLDGELKSFFDRYNDLLYWGLMVFSLFGSGLAGLLSYSKADDRVRRLHALERLVAIAKAARVADSIQAIEALQDEVDEIHVGMIREVETNTLDETAVLAYGVSFEQAHVAIADRRAVLYGLPPRPLAAVASL